MRVKGVGGEDEMDGWDCRRLFGWCGVPGRGDRSNRMGVGWKILGPPSQQTSEKLTPHRFTILTPDWWGEGEMGDCMRRCIMKNVSIKIIKLKKKNKIL